MFSRLDSRPDDREDTRVVSSKKTGRKRGDSGRADGRHRGCVEQRAELSRFAVGEHHLALVAIEPTGRIVLQDEQELGAEHRLRRGAVSRHPHRSALHTGRSPERAQRLAEKTPFEIGERLLHDVDALAHQEQALDFVVPEDDQFVLPAPRSVIFCTRQLPISPTQSSFSVRQSSSLTVPNSFASLPARRTPEQLAGQIHLVDLAVASMSSGGFEFEM